MNRQTYKEEESNKKKKDRESGTREVVCDRIQIKAETIVDPNIHINVLEGQVSEKCYNVSSKNNLEVNKRNKEEESNKKKKDRESGTREVVCDRIQIKAETIVDPNIHINVLEGQVSEKCYNVSSKNNLEVNKRNKSLLLLLPPFQGITTCE
ncbi:hypothetical protein DEO72_LG10g3609 [Vigna unguiculata]|uniref:Uncharacterized protein n=1 Tax=Vigna unguiculata TaxID=3917 RepID=A0A4D6NKF3_VIGUN|nr:hypothetical protein DEO72_LG10g3609 [Vigna unguiculata]